MIEVFGVNSAGVNDNSIVYDIQCPQLKAPKTSGNNWSRAQCAIRAVEGHNCVKTCMYGQEQLAKLQKRGEDSSEKIEKTWEEIMVERSEVLLEFGRLKTFIDMRNVVVSILKGRTIYGFMKKGYRATTLRANIHKMCRAANPELYEQRPKATRNQLDFFRANAKEFISGIPHATHEEISDYLRARKMMFRSSRL